MPMPGLRITPSSVRRFAPASPPNLGLPQPSHCCPPPAENAQARSTMAAPQTRGTQPPASSTARWPTARTLQSHKQGVLSRGNAIQLSKVLRQ